METKHLTIKRANELEKMIGFLSDYKTQTKEIHIIVNETPESKILTVENSLHYKNEEYTQYLKRLGELNVERDELIAKFSNYNS